jgi:hypothetical protein
MKMLALAVSVLLVGCAASNSSTTGTDARLIKLQNQSKKISERAQAELAARERAEYEDEAQQQRDRASLMAILTTSQSH